MMKEVKRNGWSRFCKKFSSDNQYRTARLSRGSDTGFEVYLGASYPFLGILIEKKGRLIDGIQLVAGRGDYDMVLDPVASLKDPSKMVIHTDEQGQDSCLEIHSKDGELFRLDLEGGKERSHYYALVEKVAYNLFERRGAASGSDWNDWLAAENKVKEAEAQITE